MISGVLLLDTSKPLDTKNFYKRRFAKVGIPTVIWISLYLVILIFTHKIISIPAFFQRLLSLDILHLYFLVLILELYFVTPLFYGFLKINSEKAKKILLASTFVLTTVVTATSHIFPKNAVDMTTNIVTVFIPFLFYYLLGPTLKKIRLSISSFVSLLIFVAYEIIFIAIISRGNVVAYSRSFEGLPVMILSIITFILFLQLNRWSFLKNLRFQGVLTYFSGLTFGMYLVHVLVLMFIDYYYPVIPGHVGSPMWLVVMVKGAAVVIISFGLCAVLRKLPLSKYLTP
jgi:surface polysaccharide O-acyltransferase-like enzyme